MKKIIALFLVVIPVYAFAQFSKGQVFLGGSLSASSQSNNYVPTPNNSGPIPSKGNSISISPTLGFLLNPKLAVGGSIGYSTSFSEFDYSSGYYDTNNNYIKSTGYTKTQSQGITFAPFVRYYIPISNSFYFATQGQISFTRSTNDTKQGTIGSSETDQSTPSYTLGANIKPVLIFFPSTKWGIEASVGSISYGHTRYLPNALFR